MSRDFDDSSILTPETKIKQGQFKKRFQSGPLCSMLFDLYLENHGKAGLLKNNPINLERVEPPELLFGDSEHHSKGTRLEESDYSRVFESYNAIKHLKNEDIDFIEKEISYISIEKALKMKEFLDYLPATSEAIKKYVTDKNKRTSAKRKPGADNEKLNVDDECIFPYMYYIVQDTKKRVRVVACKSTKERDTLYRMEKTQKFVNLAELIRRSIKKKSERYSRVEEQKNTRLSEANRELNRVKEDKKKLEVLNSAKKTNDEELLEQLDNHNTEINRISKKNKELQERILVLESVKTRLEESCEENLNLKEQMQTMKKRINKLTEENMLLKDRTKQSEETLEQITIFLNRDPSFKEYMQRIESVQEAKNKMNEFSKPIDEDTMSDQGNHQDNKTETQSIRSSFRKPPEKRNPTPGKRVGFT